MSFFKMTRKNIFRPRNLCIVRKVTLCISLLLVAIPLFGQNESILKKFFEGKTIVVKIDMPATKEGVDLYPLREQPINFNKYGDRIKKYGTAVFADEKIMITKIKIKSKHIEFQLGGGGYGTAGDDMGYVAVPYVRKSKREKDLEKAVKREPNTERKKELQRELDYLRRERQREEKRLRIEAEQQRAINESIVREKAQQAGSRFNIRYDYDLRLEEKTPESVMAALQEYVEFLPESFGGVGGSEKSGMKSDSSKWLGSDSLRKGLLWEEVASMLGAPTSINERMEGKLKVITCTFIKGEQKIEAEFVEGVLIKYTISSK
ncbi:MAG: hypothetical protein JSV96_18580 [Candidatus Aminicenantes bacterium]|nr:MAG: hypothetical protein JSV96_18580 [Candidatus Aminicenantes bacterium]